MSTATSAHTSAQSGTYDAFRSANFRLYFAGQLVSNIGTWVQNIAQAYLVFQITQNPLWSGIVACAAGAPLVLLSPITGVIVERYPRRRIMLVTQTVQMLLAFILTALVVTGWIQIWHVLVLAFVLGITNALDQPSRQTIVMELVGRELLHSGITLNSMMNSAARLIGPTLAGVALVTLGVSWCFFLNGLSFVAVIVSLLLMKVPYSIMQAETAAPLTLLREGLSYVRRNATLLPLILIAACVGFFSLPILQLFAAFASESLHSPEVGFAAISAGEGLGAILAALLASWLVSRVGRAKLIAVMAGLNTLATVGLSLQHAVLPAMLMSALMGLFVVTEVMNVNTLLQTEVADAFRGRTLALYSLAFFGLAPFGSLVMGGFAEQVGTAEAIAVSTLLCGVFTGLILLRWPQVLHPVRASA